jgi:hypothetical protein
VKRFLKTFVLLVVSLFALISGVDTALAHYSISHTKNSLVVYNESGTAVLAFEGDLGDCKILTVKATGVQGPAFHLLHRT